MFHLTKKEKKKKKRRGRKKKKLSKKKKRSRNEYWVVAGSKLDQGHALRLVHQRTRGRGGG